jgi:hypothetical protein
MDKHKMIKNIEENLYEQIISFFKKVPNKEKTDIEKWKYQIYRKLMNMMEQPREKMVVRNAILLILSLFSDLPPDLYNSRGKELENISSNSRKTEILSDLREEIEE